MSCQRQCASTALLLFTLISTPASADELSVNPKVVKLSGPLSVCQLILRQSQTGQDAAGDRDLTHSASYRSADEAIATVSKSGLVRAVGQGETTIEVSSGEWNLTVPVSIDQIDKPTPPQFTRDVLPVLSKAGCNMGACHASQYGKGGFKLSVFGFDPASDQSAIVRDRHQRRINLLTPDDSLLLKKPSMSVPHGGGKRLPQNSISYQILHDWIAAGAPGPGNDDPDVVALHVTPDRRVGAVGLTQQLRVDAEYSDGTRRDVTLWAKFDSMDEAVLSVSQTGLVTAEGAGQAGVMVRFEGRASVCMFVIPYQTDLQLTDWVSNNFVDELAAAKFSELGIPPSPLCDDASFVRRAFLDAIGTLPTVEQAKAFIDSDDPDKRNQLIDELLGLSDDPSRNIHNDAYAAYWTVKWSDLIRNNSNSVGEQGMWALHNWIRESFRVNRPFDDFVKELVTARGSIYMNGPANFFRIHRNANELAEATAQLFLGVRLQCAQCHHHPFEAYSQADYYSFAAFFARVSTKNSQEFGLFGRESVILVRNSGEVKHPRTGKTLPPTPPGGEASDHPLDRRVPLAEWLTSKDNEYFAPSIVNRYVGYLLGHGLVEPIDDMRATNPASNPELMAALANHFRETDYDLKQLIRTIMRSRLYQLSSQPLEGNARDRRFFSTYRVRRIPAEALLDAIDVATGSQTKFRNLPSGTRAIELPDAEYPNTFLTTFAKPRRASVCECERNPDQNLAQSLHLLNGATLTSKIADKNGRVAKLISDKADLTAITEDLYLATLSRRPTDAELALAKDLRPQFAADQEFAEDLLWSLINSQQFLFNR